MSVNVLLNEFSKLDQKEQFFFLNRIIASRLDKAKRIQLIKIILEDLEDEPEVELAEKQLQELDRRWKEIEDGTAKLTPMEEVHKKITEKYGFDISLT